MSDDHALTALERRMNRPLALAVACLVVSMGVFLVGLILIVDSTNKVSFPAVIAVTTPLPQKGAVAVSNNGGTVGQVTRASLSQGGRVATATTNAPTIGEAGQVGYRKTTTKTVRRPTAIGGTSGPNGDAGLGNGSKGPAVAGEQSSTPANGTTSP